jgi:hypothetical protein
MASVSDLAIAVTAVIKVVKEVNQHVERVTNVDRELDAWQPFRIIVDDTRTTPSILFH